MGIYVVRRLLATGPVLLLISICIFAIIEVAPGDPVRRIARKPGALSSTQMQNLRKEYGLDDPIAIRYLKWLSHALRGDLGYSFTTRRPVVQEILDRLPNTMSLMAAALFGVIFLSIPIGVMSAARQYSVLDILITTIAFMGQAIPVYWLGSLLILIFHNLLTNPLTSEPLLPIGGVSSWGSSFNLLDRLEHLILPATALAFGWISIYTRFLRSSTLDVLRQDYVTTARGKGLAEASVLLRHVLKNAILPLVTVLALDLPTIVSGALFAEIIFSWPGLGQLFYGAAKARDYNLLMATTMMTSTAVVLCNLLADIAYACLDPRVHFSKLTMMDSRAG